MNSKLPNLIHLYLEPHEKGTSNLQHGHPPTPPPPLWDVEFFFLYFNKVSFCYVFHFLTKHINIAQTQLHTDSNNNNNNNRRKETNPSTFSSIYMKKNNK